MDKSKIGIVYAHITPSAKMYIGVTSQTLSNRFGKDGYGYRNCTLFWRAIQKYGWDNIKHITIFDDLPYEVALLVEQALIQKYSTNDPKFGYNLTAGGEGILGYKYTPEQLVNHRYWLGKHHTDETKRKLSEINTGRKLNLTDEQLKVLSERRKGKPSPFKGKHHTEEALRKMSEASKGRKAHCMPHTEETKRKMSASQKGRIVSQETREKLRQKALEQWQRQKQKLKKEE